jgi:hypothetical protein
MDQWTTQTEDEVIFEHGVVLELVEYPKKFVFTFFSILMHGNGKVKVDAW